MVYGSTDHLRGIFVSFLVIPPGCCHSWMGRAALNGHSMSTSIFGAHSLFDSSLFDKSVLCYLLIQFVYFISEKIFSMYYVVLHSNGFLCRFKMVVLLKHIGLVWVCSNTGAQGAHITVPQQHGIHHHLAVRRCSWTQDDGTETSVCSALCVFEM